MASNSALISWIGRKELYFIFGVPLLCFALAPFPFGCGMVYPIVDNLRGHPERPHGTQPERFVGLWVREEMVMYDFFGQAFYLMPDGRLAGLRGMSRVRWHFDDGRLFIDSASGCGNCYRGNATTALRVQSSGPHEISVYRKDDRKRGIVGRYRRLEITDALRSDLALREKSENESESFNARCVLKTIEEFERFSPVAE